MLLTISSRRKALRSGFAEPWLNLQNRYDVETARLKIAAELARIEPVNDKAA